MIGSNDTVVFRLSFPLWLYYSQVGFLNPEISLSLDLNNLHFIFILMLLISPKTSGKKQFIMMHFCGTKCTGIPNLTEF